LEIFFAVVGGVIFLPLIKLHAMSSSKRVKNFIVVFLIVTLFFTLKGCASTLNSIADSGKLIPVSSK